MPSKRAPKTSRTKTRVRPGTELVVITGMSGSGKGSVLKVFEDLGYYCVDNLPVELIPSFAELIQQSQEIHKAALVLDVREGARLERLPSILRAVKKRVPTRVLFLEASDEVLQRRFSETRRPHPMGSRTPVKASIAAERKRINPIAPLADETIDTSKFNVHELRASIAKKLAATSWFRQSASAFATAFPKTPTWYSMCAFCPIRTSCPSSAR